MRCPVLEYKSCTFWKEKKKIWQSTFILVFHTITTTIALLALDSHFDKLNLGNEYSMSINITRFKSNVLGNIHCRDRLYPRLMSHTESYMSNTHIKCVHYGHTTILLHTYELPTKFPNPTNRFHNASHAVEFRYITVQYKTIFHTALRWLKQNINASVESHIRISYGCICEDTVENWLDRITTAPHCVKYMVMVHKICSGLLTWYVFFCNILGLVVSWGCTHIHTGCAQVLEYVQYYQILWQVYNPAWFGTKPQQNTTK